MQRVDSLRILINQLPFPLSYFLLGLLDDQHSDNSNHLAELVCWHLKDGEWDNKHLLRTLLELFHLRDAFRTMRGSPMWK